MRINELTTAKLDQYTKAANADYDKAKEAGDSKRMYKRGLNLMKASGKKIDNDVKALQKARGVAEGFKNSYSVGDRVDSPLGTGTIVALSKNIDIDDKVSVKLDDPSKAGEDGKHKDTFVLTTSMLKHLPEQGVAEGFFDRFKSKKPEIAKTEPKLNDGPLTPQKTEPVEKKSQSITGPKFIKNLLKFSKDFSYITLKFNSDGTLNIRTDYDENNLDEVYIALQEIKLLKQSLSAEKREFRELKSNLRYEYSQEVANRISPTVFSGMGGFSKLAKGVQRGARQASRSTHLSKLKDVDNIIMMIDKIIAIFNNIELKLKKELIAVKKQGVAEGFADDFAAFAKERGGKLRHGPQPAKPATAPAAPQPTAPVDREALSAELKQLQSQFDPQYQYSDDYSFWSKQDAIAKRIDGIKKQLGLNEETKLSILDKQLRRELDPQTTELINIARSHYPSAKSDIGAVLKLLQRVAMHSKEEDRQHNAEISDLQQRVKDLEQRN